MARKSSVDKVRAALSRLGLAAEVVELPASTRTAVEAAEALGCEVAQTAKSLVFRGELSDKPYLVVACGANRVDEVRLPEFAGEPVAKASADFVRERTGFAVGGVSPVGHTSPIEAFIDEDLLDFDVIWAAAGSPYGVFQVRPRELETDDRWSRRRDQTVERQYAG